MNFDTSVANCPNCGAPLTAFNAACPYCGTMSPKTLILDKTEPVTITFTGFDSKKRTMKIRLDTLAIDIADTSTKVFADDCRYRVSTFSDWRIQLEGILLPMDEDSGKTYLIAEEQSTTSR